MEYLISRNGRWLVWAKNGKPLLLSVIGLTNYGCRMPASATSSARFPRWSLRATRRLHCTVVPFRGSTESAGFVRSERELNLWRFVNDRCREKRRGTGQYFRMEWPADVPQAKSILKMCSAFELDDRCSAIAKQRSKRTEGKTRTDTWKSTSGHVSPAMQGGVYPWILHIFV